MNITAQNLIDSKWEVDMLAKTKVKIALLICGTVLAAIAMITKTELPDWAIRIGTMLVGGF